MAHGHHQHQQFAVFDLAENPVIPGAITPKTCHVSLERLAEAAGVGVAGNTLVETGNDVPLGRMPLLPLYMYSK